MLVLVGEDHRVPPATADQQRRSNVSVSEYVQITGRGHSITIDAGWQEVAQTCLDSVAHFVR